MGTSGGQEPRARRQRAVSVAVVVALALVSVSVIIAAGRAEAGDRPLPAETVGSDKVLVSERSMPKNWGVTGYNGYWAWGDRFGSINTQVTSFAQIGDTLYVGGKFAEVERFDPPATFDQPFLAAFDIATGEWIPSFRPELNGVVWDIIVRDDGMLMVGGQFSNIGGVPDTEGLAVIDPITGQPDPGFTASLTQPNGRGLAMTLLQVGDQVYVGGLFNRLLNKGSYPRPVGRIARIDAATGQLDGDWRPNIHGVVFDIAEMDDQVYVAGNIYSVNGVERVGSARISALSNTLLSGSHTPRARPYQQAVLAHEGKIYIGGSEHHLQVDNADYSLINQFWTAGGDFQAVTEANGYVYAGNHSSGNITDGNDTVAYSFTVAIDTDTHKLEEWVGAINRASEGVWALTTDSDDCIWAGGDFISTVDTSGQRVPAGSFARFCPPDQTPPTVPAAPYASFGASGVTVRWGASTDTSSPVRYELYRNGTLIVDSLERRDFLDSAGTTDDVYRVRAVDPAGNKSATTGPVYPSSAGSGAAPIAVIDITSHSGHAPAAVYEFSAAGSSDPDGQVVSWYWEFGDGTSSSLETPTHTFAIGGDHVVVLTVVDDSGRVARTSTVIDVPGPAPVPGAPTYRYDDETKSEIWSWTPAVGAAEYTLHVNGQPYLTTTASEVATFLPAGRNELTVTALRLDGTQSDPSASTLVTNYSPANYSAGALASLSAPEAPTATAELAIDGITEQTYPNIAMAAAANDARVDIDLQHSLEFDTVQYHNGTTGLGAIDAATLMVSNAELATSFDTAVASSSWSGVFPVKTGAEQSFRVPTEPTRYLRVAEPDSTVQVGELSVLHHARPPQISNLAGDQPVAAAAVESVNGTTVSFSSQGSADPDGTIGRYYWNFGDGTYSNQANPTHEYLVGGTHSVTLVVADAVGKLSQRVAVSVSVDGPEIAPGQPVVDLTDDAWAWTWPAAADAVSYELLVDGAVVATTTSTSAVYNPGTKGHNVNVRGMSANGTSGLSPSTIVIGESQDSLTPFATITASSVDPDYSVESIRDGDTDGVTGFVSQRELQPYIDLEIERVESISSVSITNMATDTNRMKDVRLLLSERPLPDNLGQAIIVASKVIVLSDFSGTITLDTEEVGAKYIRLQAPNSRVLQVAEIELYGVDYPVTATYESASPSSAPTVAASVVSMTPTPVGGVVDFTAEGSTDDGTIVDYFWHFEPGRFSRAASPSFAFSSPGTRTVAVTAVDNHGIDTTIYIDVTVEAGGDVSAFRGNVAHIDMPAGGTVAGQLATWSWTPTAGAVAYDILLDGEIVGATTSNSHEMALDGGVHAVTIRPVDSAGNVGAESAPTTIEVGTVSNLALRAPIRGSAPWGETSDVGNAVDGSYNGQHPATYTSAEPGAFIEVDIGRVTRIDHVGIWNRNILTERIVGSHILVSDRPMSDDLAAAQAEAKADITIDADFAGGKAFDVGVTGRYVRIHNPNSYLQIAEFEVVRLDGLTVVTYPDNAGIGSPTITAQVASLTGTAPTAAAKFGIAAELADPSAPIVDALWDFGDGSSALGLAPTHTYRYAGTYDVTVQAIDSRGTVVTSSVSVTVQGKNLQVGVLALRVNSQLQARWSWDKAPSAASYELRVDGQAVGSVNTNWYPSAVPVGEVTVVAIAADGTRGAPSSPVQYYPAGYNYARTAEATALSYWDERFRPEFGIDGSADTAFLSRSTRDNTYTLDLGAELPIDRIVINNRDVRPYRLIGANLLTSSEPFPDTIAASVAAADTVVGITSDDDIQSFEIGDTARYVRVVHINQHLQFDEIEIYGPDIALGIPTQRPSAPPTADVRVTNVAFNDDATEFTLDPGAVLDDVAVRYLRWSLPDGTTSTTTRPTLAMAPGTYPVELWLVDNNGQFVSVESTIEVPSDTEDNTAPGYARDLTGSVDASVVSLSWTAATDNVGVAEYVVLRNGTEFARTAELSIDLEGAPTGDSWWQLYAVDAAGNEGGKTAPLKLTIDDADAVAPSYVRDLEGDVFDSGVVSLSWTAATDNVGVAEYVVLRNGTEFARTSELSIELNGAPTGDSWWQLYAVDAAGNAGGKTAPVKLTVAVPTDTTPPGYPKDLTGDLDAGDLSMSLSWTAANDNVGVAEYVVLRNGTEFGRTAELSIELNGAPAGDSWWQVYAVDAAGNAGGRTAPLKLTLGTPVDNTPPGYPRDLAGEADADGVSLTWTAATDNVGVAEYVVLRNGIEFARTSDTAITLGNDVPNGDSWWQIYAVDAAGNAGGKTAPLKLTR